MKRALVLLTSTVAAIVVLATAALAQDGYAPPPTGTEVAPETIINRAPSGLSFTGSEFGALIAFAVLALALGVGLYAFGRRRSRVAD